MPPVFAHGELRLYLLVLLLDGPRHGYELITELTRRFGGTYRPSAGTIYPRLARLEEEGLVRRSVPGAPTGAGTGGGQGSPGSPGAGRKATYELTPAGRAEIDARLDDVRRLERSVAETVRSLADEVRADVRDTMRGLRAELAAAAQEVRTRPRPDSAPDPRRTQSNSLRHDAEAVLQRFRNDVLADLREADVAGTVSALTVETLRTVLDSARAAIRGTLPHSTAPPPGRADRNP